MQSESNTADSVIALANKTTSSVLEKLVFFFIIRSYVCIPSSGYNGCAATALRTATFICYPDGVYTADSGIALANKTSIVFEMFVVFFFVIRSYVCVR